MFCVKYSVNEMQNIFFYDVTRLTIDYLELKLKLLN